MRATGRPLSSCRARSVAESWPAPTDRNRGMARPEDHERCVRMAKSLGWVRFDHYSIAVRDADQAITFHEKLFGLERDHVFRSPSEGFRGGLLNMPDGQGQVEILAPMGDDSFLHRYLETRGAGVHHITVEVEDIDAAVEYLREEMGIEPYRGIWSDGQWRQTFIHPRDTGGVLYQLFEWLPGHGPDNPLSEFGPAE